MQAAAVSAPSFFHVPDGAKFTIAEEVADLMRSVGYTVETPELQALQALLPQKPNGDWIGLESAIICPRQNLKTATMMGCALHDTFIQGVGRVVWTAHEFKTSGDAFRDLRAIIEGNAWLERAVLKIRTANGKEGFELRNGSRLDILARTGRSGRGLGGDRLYADEAMFLEGKMMGALVPTLSARRNAHLVYGSSPGIRDSVVLRGIRDRGRSGSDPQLGYIEWTSERQPCANPDCLHGVDESGCQLDNEALWWQSNPALGRRISVDFVRQERRTLASAPVEFMRERLGWWEDPPSAEEQEDAIPAQAWQACEDAASRIPNGARLAFGIDTSWDRQTTWIAVAGELPDGKIHLEVIAQAFGSDWVVPWLAERVTKYKPAAIGLQGGSAPVSSIVEPLKHQLPKLTKTLGITDLGRACGQLFDTVSEGKITHIGQDQLTRAIKQAETRVVSDAWVWDRKASPVDIAPLVATTIALYLLRTTEPKKKSRAAGW